MILSTLFALFFPTTGCMLPEIGTNCDAALVVARSIKCADLGPACYETVASMYNGVDPALIIAADCDLAAPGCQGARTHCSADPSGPALCTLAPDDSVASCQNDAGQVGLPAAASCEPCARLFDVWGPPAYDPGVCE